MIDEITLMKDLRKIALENLNYPSATEAELKEYCTLSLYEVEQCIKNQYIDLT